MFIVQPAQAFGRAAFGQVPQLDTSVLGVGATLAQAESNIKAAFNALQIASVAAPKQPISPQIIAAYSNARNGFAAAVKVWIDGYNQTPEDQRNPDDPKAVPVLPPDIGILTSSGLAGFGTVPAKPVLPSQLVVKYGPIGREKVSGLADSFHDPYFAYAYSDATAGLGNPILILIGIAILAGTAIAVTALLTRESDGVKIARADADRQAAVSASANNALQQRKDLILKCVGTSTDPNAFAACTQAADQGAIPLLQALPQIKPSLPGGGGSVLATIGVIALIGVVVGGGYMLYRRGQRDRSALPRASRMQHGADDTYDTDEW